jgi:hypothetical protein
VGKKGIVTANISQMSSCFVLKESDLAILGNIFKFGETLHAMISNAKRSEYECEPSLTHRRHVCLR